MSLLSERKEQNQAVHAGRKPSMRQVAELAGVGVSTVSRVISNHPDVSQKMRERVLLAVQELGYEPDFLAQSLRRGATRSIGFALSDITNPVVAQIIHGAEEALRNAGYSLLVMDSERNPALDTEHIHFLHSRHVDGLILLATSERRRATIDALLARDTPVVVIDRDFPKRLRASAVLTDHQSGMAAAAGHLLDLGHRRIGLLSWPLDLRPGRERLAGLRKAYKMRGLPDTSIPIPVTGFSAEEGVGATQRLLDLPERPTAIIAGSNQLLIGCLRTLAKNRLRPGIDLALVTYDDIPLAELFTPPLAVIARDNIATGRVAVELLLRRINGHDKPETVILETQFVPRASCCSPSR
jgi:LacI family transcriptional regulator